MKSFRVIAVVALAWAAALPAVAQNGPPAPAAAPVVGSAPETAPAPAPAPELDPQSQRILTLERKLEAAQRYILGLRAELDNLKTGGVPTPGPTTSPQPAAVVQAPEQPAEGAAAPPTPATPSAVADGDGAPGTPPSAPPESKTVARAPAEPPAPKPVPRSEEESGPDPDQPQPVFTPAFLRQARAVLIPKNRLEIEPRLQYNYRDTNVLAVSGLDIVEAIFIGKIEVEKRRRQSLTATVGGRYGFTENFQGSFSIPYLYQYEELITPPGVQRFPDPIPTSTNEGSALGDIEFGLSYHVLHERGWKPDVIVSATAKSDTGRGPFEDLGSNDLATGSGFWGIRPQVTFVKVTDPGVLFLSGSYLYHHRDDVTDIGEVDPGDIVQWSAGYAYALNPFLSLTTRIESNYFEELEVDGVEIGGTDAVVSTLSFGLTYGLGRYSSLEVGIDVGISEDAPDFRVSLGMPFQFLLSSDFWGHLVPDLTKVRSGLGKLWPDW